MKHPQRFEPSAELLKQVVIPVVPPECQLLLKHPEAPHAMLMAPRQL